MSVLYDIKDIKNILNNIFFSIIVNSKHIIWRRNNKSFFAANQARQNTVQWQCLIQKWSKLFAPEKIEETRKKFTFNTSNIYITVQTTASPR